MFSRCSRLCNSSTQCAYSLIHSRNRLTVDLVNIPYLTRLIGAYVPKYTSSGTRRSYFNESNINYMFSSDNSSGVHPHVLEAIANCNHGHELAYGADSVSKRVSNIFKNLIGPSCEAFLVFGGTGANVVGLSSVLQRHQAALCSDVAHLNRDECGAPEKVIGKLIQVPSVDGKVTVDSVRESIYGIGDQHCVQPTVLSLSQCTEYATVYTLDELSKLREFANENNLMLHMDGARIANAAISLACPLRDIITFFDVVSFGGTKNGLLCGEAVIFPNGNTDSVRVAVQRCKFVRKQCMQLPSKTRFLAAQFLAYFEDGLWFQNATKANTTASYLADQLTAKLTPIYPEFKLTRAVEANGVFAKYPLKSMDRVKEYYEFHVWDEAIEEVRLMCSFDTETEDVDVLVKCMAHFIQN